MVCGVVPSGQTSATAIVAGNTKGCQTATEAQLWFVTSETMESPFGITQGVGLPRTAVLSPSGTPLNSTLVLMAKQLVTEPCAWTFRALQPGNYVASLKTPVGSGGSQAFTIEANATVQVAIPEPTVFVSGRAMINEKPVIEGVVEFVRFLIPLSTPFVFVQTDSDGRYTAVLDRPGQYRVRLSTPSPRRTLLSVERPFSAGTNVVDLFAK
jgi:hypothetical protein